MKRRLDEVKKLQKLAGIIKENQNYFDDGIDWQNQSPVKPVHSMVKSSPAAFEELTDKQKKVVSAIAKKAQKFGFQQSGQGMVWTKGDKTLKISLDYKGDLYITHNNPNNKYPSANTDPKDWLLKGHGNDPDWMWYSVGFADKDLKENVNEAPMGRTNSNKALFNKIKAVYPNAEILEVPEDVAETFEAEGRPIIFDLSIPELEEYPVVRVYKDLEKGGAILFDGYEDDESPAYPEMEPIQSLLMPKSVNEARGGRGFNAQELISILKTQGPQPAGPPSPGEYNVTLAYADYPSIPEWYMTNARDIFMAVVAACGGKAILNGSPSPEQSYTVMGCAFPDIEAMWKFLASDAVYDIDTPTATQANGCANTWQIESDYDYNSQDSTQDPGYDPRYDSSIPE